MQKKKKKVWVRKIKFLRILQLKFISFTLIYITIRNKLISTFQVEVLPLICIVVEYEKKMKKKNMPTMQKKSLG